MSWSVLSRGAGISFTLDHWNPWASRVRLVTGLLLMGLICMTATHSANAQIAPDRQPFVPVDLRCELAVDPLGIDVPQPRLFWRLSSGQRGQRQTAYQILVASSLDELSKDRGDLWNSGRVESDQTTYVRYAGQHLHSSQHVFWKVRSWDRDGHPSPWSAAATWTMGLLDPRDWQGVWICAPAASESLLLRKEFTIRSGLRRAIAHASGLGQYEINFNGSKSGAALLSPGWTNYNRTILYDSHDVTSLLHEGPNAVGIILGNGMYNVVRRNRFAKFTGSFGPLKTILHLHLEYADGSIERVGTDDSWRTHPGPITYNSIYGGEDFDAQLEPHGWDKPGFNDRSWTSAVVQVRPSGMLRGHSAAAEPIGAIETRQPVSMKEFDDGTIVYDFGQNASFMPRIRVTGPIGSTVRLTPAEVVDRNGAIFRATMGSPSRGLSWWQYTKATNDEETWFPRFYYLGSRYVKTESLPPAGGDAASLPRISGIESVIVHSTASPIGEFSCSNDTLNRIRDLIRWSMRSNMVSVLTDCPHREKLGWLEQTHFVGPALRYEFDLARLFAKCVRDMSEAQLDTGMVPNIAPEFTEFKGNFRSAAEWGAAFIAVPWQQYQFSGDIDLLRAQYPAMKGYLAYLESRATNDMLSDGLGDWYDVGPNKPGAAQLTPSKITATAILFQDAQQLAQIASILGQSADAEQFATRAEQIRVSFNRHFFNRETGVYGSGSQSSYAIPLAMGIVEPADRERVLAALIREIEQNNYGTTCGNVGFRYLLRALADAGRSDVIYRMLLQDAKPGYAYQLKRGETSLCESWDANLGSSHNHFMFGQAIEWFYHDLAGIQPDPSAPGFKKIIIRPNPVGDLAWVEATHNSIHGEIRVRWERNGERFLLNVTIPANTTATVYLPDGKRQSIESGSHVLESR